MKKLVVADAPSRSELPKGIYNYSKKIKTNFIHILGSQINSFELKFNTPNSNSPASQKKYQEKLSLQVTLTL